MNQIKIYNLQQELKINENELIWHNKEIKELKQQNKEKEQ